MCQMGKSAREPPTPSSATSRQWQASESSIFQLYNIITMAKLSIRLNRHNRIERKILDALASLYLNDMQTTESWIKGIKMFKLQT